MKKVILLGFIVLLCVGVVSSDTDVSTSEKDNFIELLARKEKVSNLLQAELDELNAENEAAYNTYLAALQANKDTHQPDIVKFRNELETINSGLKEFK